MAFHFIARTLLVSLATLLALAACGPRDAEITRIVDDRLAQALSAILTPIPLPTATPTPPATPTPSPSPSPTPIPTPTLTPTATPTPAPTSTPVVITRMPDVASVVNNVGPAVVQVLATTSVGISQGSGVIFSQDGHILTNNHVVEDSTSVQVALANRKTVEASIVGTDPETDLAVLKIAPADIVGLAAARLGNTDAMQIGDWVIAIGSPLGYAGSVTVGVISAKDRSLDFGDERLYNLLQTDAVINPGNSGGPLLNLAGEVIGINTAIIRGRIGTNQEAEGIGFSISMGIAIPVTAQLIERGTVIRPKFGINIVDVTPALATSRELSIEVGVLITSVTSGGAAQSAGLRANDVITHLDGTAIQTTSDLIRKVLAGYQIGDIVTVTATRGLAPLKFIVTLGS